MSRQYVTIVRTERITRVVEITLYIDPDELDLNDPDFSPWECDVVEDDHEILESEYVGPWAIESVEVGS